MSERKGVWLSQGQHREHGPFFVVALGQLLGETRPSLWFFDSLIQPDLCRNSDCAKKETYIVTGGIHILKTPERLRKPGDPLDASF